MSDAKYKRLKEVMELVNPYDDNTTDDELDDKRTEINGEFFQLCFELVPILIERLEDYLSWDSHTVEQVIDELGGWNYETPPNS